MSKFSTFLVFVFGIFVMIAIAVTFTQRQFFSLPPQPAEEKLVLPPCDLPAFEMGTREQFGLRLSKLASVGGLESVKQFVEKEFVPGRAVMTADSASDPLMERRVLDREVRRCDSEGVTPLDKPPLVARALGVQRVGDNVKIQTWPRLEGSQPFVLTVWWVVSGAR